MEEFNPPELKKGNDYTLKSMCLESLETSPVILPTKREICYGRLSSDHQREKSQVGILDRFYPGTEIIKDIGSGLNFRKKGFISLLDRVYLGEVKEIIVLYNDRL
jgi:predicted site-specific integrase-resolvase